MKDFGAEARERSRVETDRRINENIYKTQVRKQHEDHMKNYINLGKPTGIISHQTTQTAAITEGNMLAYFIIHDESKFENRIMSVYFEIPCCPHPEMWITEKIGGEEVCFTVLKCILELSPGPPAIRNQKILRIEVECSTEDFETVRAGRPDWPPA